MFVVPEQCQRAQCSRWQVQQVEQGGVSCRIAISLSQAAEQCGQIAVAEQGNPFGEFKQQIALFVEDSRQNLVYWLAGMG